MNAGFGKVVEQWDRPDRLLETESITNTYFETNLFYIDLRLMRYFFIHSRVQPYIGFGPSLFFFNPKDQDGSFLIDNIFTRELGEEFPTTTFVWPATIGFNVPFGKALAVSADYTYRLNMTDYIDNIGLLGEDPGRDRIHAFQVSFSVNLGVRDVEPREVPLEEDDPRIAAIESIENPLKRKLAYRKIQKNHHRVSDKVNQMEVDYILYEEMPSADPTSEPSVFAPSKESLQTSPGNDKDWGKLYQLAEANNAFIKVKTGGVLSKKAWPGSITFLEPPLKSSTQVFPTSCLMERN